MSAEELAAKLAAKRKSKIVPYKPARRAPTPRQQLQKPESEPEAPEIEKAVLSLLLEHPQEVFSAFEHTARASFFKTQAREWFVQMHAFYREKNCFDVMAFLQFILDNPKIFDPIGGRVFWAEIQNIFPPLEMLDFYISELREKYERRLVISRCSTLIKEASGDKDNEIDFVRELTKTADWIANARIIKPTLYDAARYLNGEMPPLPPEIVYHIVHQGSKMVVGGTSKGRKTMALIDLAISVATGGQWWGFHTRRGPVCYINFEIQEGFFAMRTKQICDLKNLELERGMFYVWNLRGRAEGIETLLQEILSVLKQVRFVLVIIDPIYKALGGRDENRAGDVASMLNEVEKIAVETGAAVAFGAHYSKGNQAMKEHVDRIGGSGVFARDPDTILTMTAHEEDECFTVESTLRNFPPLSSFVVKWEWPLFVRCDADPNQLKKARGAKSQFVPVYKKEMILDELSVQQGFNATELRLLLDKREGMSKPTFYRFRQQLLAEGLVVEKDGALFKSGLENPF